MHRDVKGDNYLMDRKESRHVGTGQPVTKPFQFLHAFCISCNLEFAGTEEFILEFGHGR